MEIPVQKWEDMTAEQKCDQLREEIQEVRIVVNTTAKKVDELTRTVALVMGALQELADKQPSEASPRSGSNGQSTVAGSMGD